MVAAQERRYLRAIVLAYRLIVLDADPNALSRAKLCRSHELDGAALVETFFGGFNFASRAHRYVDFRRILLLVLILLCKSADLVPLLVCKDGI